MSAKKAQEDKRAERFQRDCSPISTWLERDHRSFPGDASCTSYLEGDLSSHSPSLSFDVKKEKPDEPNRLDAARVILWQRPL